MRCNITVRITLDADSLETATQTVQDALSERIDTDADISDTDAARMVGFHIKRAACDESTS